MPKVREREHMSYRWNEDLLRVEYWDSVEWRPSMCPPPVEVVVRGTDYPLVSYDESWCEPVGR